MLSFVLVSFKGNPTDDISLQKIFMQATCIVKDTFAAKEVEMDLQNGVCDDDFTIDVLVDPSSGEVVACVEYVYRIKRISAHEMECSYCSYCMFLLQCWYQVPTDNRDTVLRLFYLIRSRKKLRDLLPFLFVAPIARLGSGRADRLSITFRLLTLNNGLRVLTVTAQLKLLVSHIGSVLEPVCFTFL
jgi:hypothetical protein